MCKKYQTYANQAQDPQLKQLFSSLAQKEQEHLNTINQILNGQVQMSAGTIRTTANSNWTTNAAKETCNAKSPSKKMIKLCVKICYLWRNMCPELMIPLYLKQPTLIFVKL